MKIEKSSDLGIKVSASDGSFMETQSVETSILFAILEKLEEIRCGIIDVEDKIGK